MTHVQLEARPGETADLMKAECNTVMERERVTVSRRILPTEIATGSIAPLPVLLNAK